MFLTLKMTSVSGCQFLSLKSIYWNFIIKRKVDYLDCYLNLVFMECSIEVTLVSCHLKPDSSSF